jgi:large subunit ribosomal protein L7/L12
LTSFDTTKKIGLIKEVRGIMNLGLKESKEVVENCPTVIAKGIKSEDAEAMMKKLTEAGAKITLK